MALSGSFADGNFQHNGQNYRIGHRTHSANFQHQHSAPDPSNRDGSGRSQKSFAGSVSASYAGDEDTPRTSASEMHNAKSEGALARTTSAHAPLIGSSYEIAALRKHAKVLEDRLRAERHTHAVKFSEVEKQLIQENAKLKVSTSALQRQIKREQQTNTDNEDELSKLRKERKSRFSLSGITRSFSDVRLEDMELKVCIANLESSLKRKNTDSEVVRMIKERLQDSEKDRLEAEGVFNQRISTLLRERNVQRTDMQTAEETIGKLVSENDALQKSAEELRTYIANIDPHLNGRSDSVQTANLRRSNQQLQEELQQFIRERNKLVLELEDLSEELTLAKANDRQNKEQHRLIVEMKSKVDSLRNNMDHKHTVPNDGPATSQVRTFPSSARPPNTGVESLLEATSQELEETRNKLASVLELSQRYELHCYTLEKELSKFYGKNYQYVETGWRKKDRTFMESLSRTVKKGKTGRTNSDDVEVHTSRKTKTVSAMCQTEPLPSSELSPMRNSASRNPQMEELLNKVNSMIELIDKISPKNSPLDGRRRGVQGKAIANAFDELLTSIRDGQSNGFSVDLTKMSEARLEVQSLQRVIRELEAKNDFLEAELRRLRLPVQTIDYDSQFEDDDALITQAEVEEKIRQVRSQLAQGNDIKLPANALLNSYESPLTDYTAKTSGVWTYSESNSSNGEEAVQQVRTLSVVRA